VPSLSRALADAAIKLQFRAKNTAFEPALEPGIGLSKPPLPRQPSSQFGTTNRAIVSAKLSAAIKAEWARVEAAEEPNIRAENVIAEEISLGKEFELL
jgi:hypothetical protein